MPQPMEIQQRPPVLLREDILGKFNGKGIGFLIMGGALFSPPIINATTADTAGTAFNTPQPFIFNYSLVSD